MSGQNIDLIAFNETQLSNNITNNQVKLSNYELIRKDRNRNGGGVCIYIKNHVNFKVRHDLMHDNTEAIIIEVTKPNSKPFAVVVAYRAPDCNPGIFFEDISNAIKMIDFELKEIYILGDLNCDLHSSKTYRPTDLLNSLSELYQLDQDAQEILEL